jgi:hypothetical protein
MIIPLLNLSSISSGYASLNSSPEDKSILFLAPFIDADWICFSVNNQIQQSHILAG